MTAAGAGQVTMRKQFNFEIVQEIELPPAAKGGNPLWKPYLFHVIAVTHF